ncbi:hypothetical protein SCRES1_gp56 [Synechococcus phage S-CRES1]|nr:hypothetical protein SCRES1_gp56 [Synechococcus phage S-CRES1]
MAKDVIIFMEKVTREEIEEMRSELPTDLHLIEYIKGTDLFLDAVRAYKMSEIFDYYYDSLNEAAEAGAITNFEIVSITSGYGQIKPKLFQG